MDSLVKTTAIRRTTSQDRNIYRLLIMLGVVFVLMTALRPGILLRPAYFNSMMRQFPEYGIMALGISLTMISGGIDLAVVGTANLSAIVAAKFLIGLVPRGAPAAQVIPMLVVAVLIALATGAACGALSGLLISRLWIKPILATLGTQQIFTGIAIVITEGKPQSLLPILYSKIGNAELFNFFPLSFIIYCVVAVVIGIVLVRLRFGMQVHMLGTNAVAARFAGLHNASILLRTYMISGVLSAVAGLIAMARVNSAKPDYGSTYTLQCILIAVLGGVDPNGGFGNIWAVSIAVLVLQFLSSGINMFEHVDSTYRDIMWGGVLILVLIFNWIIKRQAQRRLGA